MANQFISGPQIRGAAWTLAAVLVSAAVAVAALTDLPKRWGIAGSAAVTSQDPPGPNKDHDHEGHDHEGDDHEGHDHGDESKPGENFVELSPQARGNLDLQTRVLEPSAFTRYVTMPGTIMDRPGRTHVSITAPLTGVVNAIYVTHGELIRSGQSLFSLRLTHQDLVKAQSDFLAAMGRLDVENRELERLRSVTRSGAIAGKTLLQREYERDKLLAQIRADRQAMLLHGLTESQIARIEEDRMLVREVTIYAPILHGDESLHHESDHDHSHGDPSLPPGAVPQVSLPGAIRFASSETVASSADESDPISSKSREHLEAEFLVTQLNVNRGQSVEAGTALGRLSDYSSVLIEGHAFQKDAKALRTAATLKLPLQAVFESAGSRPEVIDDLQISYIGSEVELDTRALPFFVSLENKIERSEQRGNLRYVSWRFKPGQRLQIRVPLQRFDDVFVVPIDAVAEEGAERFVFVDRGARFERRPVRVVERDAYSIAIADDGSIRSGEQIAINAAHQLQMALKKESGEVIDAHHGHSH